MRTNARRRWFYGVLLLLVSASFELMYAAIGVLRFDGVLAPDERYAVAFAWLMGVAVLALAGGRTPLTEDPDRAAWIDDGWICLLLAGMVALATLDAGIGDPSGYVLVALPVAMVHSAEPRRLILLQGGALVAIHAGVLLLGPAPEFTTFTFLMNITVAAAVAIYVGLHMEANRRRLFGSAHALEFANHALAERTRELEAANARLSQLAMTDPLTSVANRRQLFEAMDREFARARRYGHPLTIALLDLDDFGQVNKLHGVIAGDRVLAGFAAALRESVRSVDLVARYGGEEFVVLMPQTGTAQAIALLERLRERLRQEGAGSGGIVPAFSGGVAELGEAESDPVQTLARADEAGRRAKREGKNRVLAA